ncbi:hypothetical protein DN069_07810 [Streptacidiphilus pinicola]|uniref:Uncharacterized protein n=1 Tax=Streptacidiphilus pinicola TaxID=2219663 RepID=A0A2X0J7E1_9ACTN|nr:hypothetical protein [Streptacidiphilus pinicola]RAG86176.1 hypothetical protein DN069_07810 [Streptacidiphilus pinicola]
MSVDFAVFDLTELAVLDADTVSKQPSPTGFFADGVDDLMGKPSMDFVGEMCCSCSSSVSCCCSQ